MESDSSCAIELGIEDPRWAESVAGVEDFCRRCLATALAMATPRPSGPLELAVHLVSDARIRELNARFRGRNAPTDVLSFPALTPEELAEPPNGAVPRLLGDILVAFETVRDEAAREGKPLAAHLAHLLVHGLLHLLGHDHATEEEARIMEQAERRILAALGLPDPYPVPAS
ncbi:MAG TPA: rRNA maturation RNase YbeY [Rhodospirillales bacterium]|nr:rRNA maturation RNase YbeY [Rhodospirillales bacterium]